MKDASCLDNFSTSGDVNKDGLSITAEIVFSDSRREVIESRNELFLKSRYTQNDCVTRTSLTL